MTARKVFTRDLRHTSPVNAQTGQLKPAQILLPAYTTMQEFAQNCDKNQMRKSLQCGTLRPPAR